MTSEISRDEVRSAIEDKLCAHFAITSAEATDDQVFQAAAMVIREIMKAGAIAIASPLTNSPELSAEKLI